MRITISTILLFLCFSLAAQDPWPSFRGPNGSGVSTDGTPPIHWDIESGLNIAYKIRIKGLGHSSPVVWDGKVFLTTAINPEGDPYLRTGLYGESPDNPENVDHEFQVLCFDVTNGKLIWEKTVHTGKPQVQRHIKSSHANSTVATNGKYVVASFGSEGLYCFDMDGNQIWQKDLGLMDSGAFDVPEIQWGYGSSPTIHDEKVVIQCDVNNQSFLAVLDVKTGEELWRKNRDETPGWGTPTMAPYGDKSQIILNGYKHIGGYDFNNGDELWKMRGGGDIPVPRPVLGHGMVFITNAHGRLRPIYAINLDAKGDISLKEGETKNTYINWSYPRKGAYMPTPIVHGDFLFVGNDRGVLSCYKAKTGEKMFSQRIGGRGYAFTGSPIATKEHLFFTPEKGITFVLKADSSYQQVAENNVGEPCLASPAIYGDTLLIRTSKHLFGMREGAKLAVALPPVKKETVEKPVNRVEIVVDPSKPSTIFQKTDQRSSDVDAISYHIAIIPTGALTKRFGDIHAQVQASGFVNGLPRYFKIDAEIKSLGKEKPDHVLAGCDGDRFYFVDYQTRKIYSDFETGVMGSSQGPIFAALVREFHLDHPFQDEVKAEHYSMGEDNIIGDEVCWEIELTYQGNQNAKAIWYISKSDFLPRGRTDVMALPNGEVGSIQKKWTNLKTPGKFAAEHFAIPAIEGFEKVDGNAP